MSERSRKILYEGLGTFLGVFLALGLLFSVGFIGDRLDIGFLNSGGGLFVTTILVMEGLFLSVLIYASLTGRI